MTTESIHSPSIATAQLADERDTLELDTSWPVTKIMMERAAVARTIAFELRHGIGGR